jgi:ABC-2 type transport system permease protein
MGRGWLVAKHEYRKMVAKRSFLVGTLGLPLLIIAIMGIGIFTAVTSGSLDPVGYVDQAGFLDPQVSPRLDGRAGQIELVQFANQDAARQSLQSGQIQAYYFLPQDYLETREVQMVYWDEAPGGSVSTAFEAFLRANLGTGLEEATRQRLAEGTSFTVRSMDGRLEIGPETFINFIFPFAAGFLFIFTVMASAGYLLQVVSDEKENRTIEIMVTTISPEQLIAGKAVGLMGVGLTQMLAWILTIAVGLLVGGQFIPELQNFRIPWDFFLIVALFFLPAYALVAGFMTAIGGAVSEARHGQQIAGIFNLLFMLPFFFVALVLGNPNSPILVALTLFPTTAFVTISLRWGMSIVPLWQVLTSWILLTSSAGLMILASARIFRRGMLRYGQNLDLRAAWEAVFHRPGSDLERR